MQIESRIDQNTDISKDLTLWGQVGSRVIRGNLMVIPIRDSLVYVEPIYLQATQSKFPELKRVIFSYGDKVVMADTLDDAIKSVFQGIDNDIVKTIPVKDSNNAIPLSKGHIKQLYNAFKQSDSIDWTQFGELMNALDTFLNTN